LLHRQYQRFSSAAGPLYFGNLAVVLLTRRLSNNIENNLLKWFCCVIFSDVTVAGENMNNIHKVVLTCAILCVSGGNGLADTKIGIGTGVSSVFARGYGGVISIPIKLDSYILIEPYVGYTKRSEDVDTNLTDYDYNKSKTYQAGVGVYGIRKLGSEFELYFGADLAAAKSNRKSGYKDTRTNNDETSVTFHQSEAVATEYMIKPTLGVSYLVTENFTVSVDAGIYYSWGEEKRKGIDTYSSSSYSSSDASEYTVDLDSVNTFSRLIFRMMF
jgi:hypothetical protein